ncbi:MAG: lipase family protein [Sneathiella sp.]|nr:lipase family protein [Sneathiella sp.]
MTPFEAALCAKIAYDPRGAERAGRLGYSYTGIGNGGHFAWIGRRHDVTVVAFRGTALRGREKKSYRSNLSTDLIPWAGGVGLVHQGYYQALWQVIAAIKREIKGRDVLILTGHSMGGAMATLAAALLDAKRVYSFASPRIGNAEFAEGYSRAIRVTRYVNRCDFLARLPFSGLVQGSMPPAKEQYVHIGQTVRLPAFGHSMSAYLSGIRMRKAGKYSFNKDRPEGREK